MKMIGNLLLRFHARKSTHPMKDFYSKSDFALILAMEDGYMENFQDGYGGFNNKKYNMNMN